MRVAALLLMLWVAGCDSDPAPPGSVGSACVADTDCLAGLGCFQGAVGARAWPGGYCTRECDRYTDTSCPAGSVCGELYRDASGSHFQCMSTCDRVNGGRGGCREGYSCSYEGACFVGCSSDAQCVHMDIDVVDNDPDDATRTCEIASGRCDRGGNPSAESGDSCTTDSDCRPPSGRCLDGLCYHGGCDLGGANACTSNETCVGLSAYERFVFICLPRCTPGVDGLPTSPGTCPSGFACRPQESDLSSTAESGYCLFPFEGSFAGNASARTGDICTSAADCPNPLGYAYCQIDPGDAQGWCTTIYCALPSVADLGLCAGADEICYVPEDDPSRPSESAIARQGICYRRCMDDSACSPPSMCFAELGICEL